MIGNLLSGPRNELEAHEIAASDRVLPRVWQGLRAGIALALNPDDTQQVFYLAYSVDRETLPRVAERLLSLPSGRHRELRRGAPRCLAQRDAQRSRYDWASV
jgi:hypothetical protein